MAQYFHIHPESPQHRLIVQAARILDNGGVAVYPTDSCYAIGCHIGDKAALERVRRIRKLDETHSLTLICKDLTEIATYARLSNSAFRLIKALTPGPYTFLLPATRDVPRSLQHRKRKTIGLRVPDHPVTAALLEELGQPLLTTSLILPGDDVPLSEPEIINNRLGKQVDLVIDAGAGGLASTSVIDLTDDVPVIVRHGKGDVSMIGS